MHSLFDLFPIVSLVFHDESAVLNPKVNRIGDSLYTALKDLSMESNVQLVFRVVDTCY